MSDPAPTSKTQDRIRRRNLRMLTRGRADALVLMAASIDRATFDHYAERLCLDAVDVQCARDRAADSANPMRPLRAAECASPEPEMNE